MTKAMKLGGAIVSNNILNGKGKIKWCFREESFNKIDNGWRFFSDIDTEEYLNDSRNMSICDWGTIAEIEPAIMPIFELPVGTDLTLEYSNGKKFFVKSESGEIIIF